MGWPFSLSKPRMPTADQALTGRSTPMAVTNRHAVLGTPIQPPFPDHLEQCWVGMGCFWGAERMLWQVQGMWTTAVGYAAGFTPHPTYREVCSGQTGHNEVVRAVWDPAAVDFETILQVFWEGHDPTQGMRQGNDAGTQYRSGIYWTTEAQRDGAMASRERFQRRLTEAGFPEITTEIIRATEFFYAEEHHQAYLHKNPGGYCGLGGTGVSCPVGTGLHDGDG